MSQQLSRRVVAVEDGIRLDVFLARQPEVGGRSTARALLDAGQVRVGEERVRPSLTLRAGQNVDFELLMVAATDPLAPPGEPPAVRVLHEDAWMVAIDKPVGLACHPSSNKRFCEHTVASWARANYDGLPTVPEAERPGIVHRLDRDTSGVMVLARTAPALDFLRAQFRARTTQKEYRAIVYGEPRFQSDWIERPIGTDPRHPDRMTVVEEGGREAATFYEVIEQFDGFSYVRCRPRSGRTHQIRVHMTAIGHSLVGDRLYRSRRRQHAVLPEAAPDPGRQCLHALRLALPHPQTHEEVEFEAPLPRDLEDLLRWLREHRARS
ncbi:MAG: RluA family pseudouridine synthase [bacterium]|nr:RluA family pseudouridine synthase [bacterium]